MEKKEVILNVKVPNANCLHYDPRDPKTHGGIPVYRNMYEEGTRQQVEQKRNKKNQSAYMRL